MKTDITQEIEKNLKLFLLKYSCAFKISSLYLLVEEYMNQKYMYTDKIYSYNVSQSKTNLKINIQENQLIPSNLYTININITQIIRKQKLEKIYESSL